MQGRAFDLLTDSDEITLDHDSYAAALASSALDRARCRSSRSDSRLRRRARIISRYIKRVGGSCSPGSGSTMITSWLLFRTCRDGLPANP